ncbi:hypothetical protein OPV22_033243 [Ensete ventricosum]|uniref:Uncharacterized protein n=1 Tax=Ensete ventricosum TaxID=4639 RepID=A0AAV8PYW6_ENSVE|nr:hypothetical protein OPV22_033243 [Ensete ventricosum]
MEGDEECHTPTSEETRVPVFPRICPPAPKKMRRRLAPCKRKRWSSEPELIVVGTEEMEQLFRWRDQQKDDHSHAKKRRLKAEEVLENITFMKLLEWDSTEMEFSRLRPHLQVSFLNSLHGFLHPAFHMQSVASTTNGTVEAVIQQSVLEMKMANE